MTLLNQATYVETTATKHAAVKDNMFVAISMDSARHSICTDSKLSFVVWNLTMVLRRKWKLEVLHTYNISFGFFWKEVKTQVTCQDVATQRKKVCCNHNGMVTFR